MQRERRALVSGGLGGRAHDEREDDDARVVWLATRSVNDGYGRCRRWPCRTPPLPRTSRCRRTWWGERHQHELASLAVKEEERRTFPSCRPSRSSRGSRPRACRRSCASRLRGRDGEGEGVSAPSAGRPPFPRRGEREEVDAHEQPLPKSKCAYCRSVIGYSSSGRPTRSRAATHSGPDDAPVTTERKTLDVVERASRSRGSRL